MVAAASAAAAVAASTVTESAMPSEKERPPRPEVAMPRTGRSCVSKATPSNVLCPSSPFKWGGVDVIVDGGVILCCAAHDPIAPYDGALPHLNGEETEPATMPARSECPGVRWIAMSPPSFT